MPFFVMGRLPTPAKTQKAWLVCVRACMLTAADDDIASGQMQVVRRRAGRPFVVSLILIDLYTLGPSQSAYSGRIQLQCSKLAVNSL